MSRAEKVVYWGLILSALSVFPMLAWAGDVLWNAGYIGRFVCYAFPMLGIWCAYHAGVMAQWNIE